MVAKTPKAKPAPKQNKPNPILAPNEADSALKKTKGALSIKIFLSTYLNYILSGSLF